MKQRKVPLIALGIFGFLAFIIINWYPMFTEDASEVMQEIKPTISKEQAADVALRHIYNAADQQVGELETLVMLQSHMTFSGYLQKQELSERYEDLWQEKYPIDYFQVEVTDGERYWLVDVHMEEAKVIGWRESSSELGTNTADFWHDALMDYASKLGYTPDTLIKRTSEKGHHIYQVSDAKIGDAVLELHFYTNDTSIIGFEPIFNVPQSFLDWYDKQRQWMDTIQLISLCMYLLTAIAAISLAVTYKQAISFRRGILLTAIFVVFSFVQDWNAYPMLRSALPGQPESDFVASINALFSHVITFILALSLYLGLVSGDAVWRLQGYHLWARWQEHSYGQHVLTAMGRGYFISFILLGVQALLYLAGEQFLGVWGINDPQMSPYNLIIPGLLPLLAWTAAISEEAIYRVFGTALFKKLLRSKMVAILLSNMIWALAHVGYPLFPAYTRFVEVTILGLIFSWAYFRYGFITVMFAHAIFDSILMSLSLASMEGVDLAFLSLFYMVLPALIAFMIYWIHPRLQHPSVVPHSGDH